MSQIEQSWPRITRELVEDLERRYPPKRYDIKKSQEENIEYSGMVKLVETLRYQHNQQVEKF